MSKPMKILWLSFFQDLKQFLIPFTWENKNHKTESCISQMSTIFCPYMNTPVDTDTDTETEKVLGPEKTNASYLKITKLYSRCNNYFLLTIPS